MSAAAAVASGAWAMIRSEMTASDAVMPTSGTAPRRVTSPSNSSACDSPRPKLFSLRSTTTPPENPSPARRGLTCSSYIFFISEGTPGIAA